MFMASLAAYLRSRNVTTYMTLDVPTIVGPELSFAGSPLLFFAENLLLLRYAEYRGELHRVLAVLKMRFSDFDRALRVYNIRDGVGIEITRPGTTGGRVADRLGTPAGVDRPCAGSTRVRRASVMATILIVDDEKPVRQFLVAAFEQGGHQVLEAWHGQHALKVIGGHSTPLDLVIADVMMPVMGGVELCKMLREDPATVGIPIVLMSAAHLTVAAAPAPMPSLGSRSISTHSMCW